MVCLISVGILSSDNMLSKYLKLLCWYSMSILVIIPTLVAQIQLKLDTVTIIWERQANTLWKCWKSAEWTLNLENIAFTCMSALTDLSIPVLQMWSYLPLLSLPSIVPSGFLFDVHSCLIIWPRRESVLIIAFRCLLFSVKFFRISLVTFIITQLALVIFQ